jgi:hypothetical protein
MKLIKLLPFFAALLQGAAAADITSHEPQRPLPVASSRAHPKGEIHVVDVTRGDDANAGTEAAPWRTLDQAIARMPEGGVLCLRGGVYYSHAVIRTSASREEPLIIRSWPGELAVLDGGEPAFALNPDTAWEPCADGVPGEFRSVKAYPLARAEGEQDGDGEVLAMGRFIDSMIPLHGARFHRDLQSDNPWWNISTKSGPLNFVYCGPAVWQDGKTGRIHCRLAHTQLPGLGGDNYTGITDARKTPLCIATVAAGPALTLEGARHITLQDIVLRGSAVATLAIRDSADITLDGVTIYGGSPAMQVKDSAGLRMIHSACRGLSAPWMYRGALKYRSVEARLLSATSWMPTGVDNRDFEIAYCEFTDCEDGVFIGSVHGVRFHHNLVENMTDDGVFVTATSGYDGHVAGGDVRLWQNRFSRCLTTFAFGVGHGRQITLPDRVQTGDGVWITRNVFDFRRPVHYHWPKDAEDKQEPYFRGRFGGDHGSPTWEPMWVYHNTFVGGQVERPDFGNPGLGAGMGKGTTRHVLNNILCTDIGEPGTAVPKDNARFHAEGNILWSFDPANANAAAWQAKLQRSSSTAAAANQIADPGFQSYSTDWRKDIDLRASGPAVKAGVAIPADWFDPFHGKEIGAVPSAGQPWRIGIHGRMDVFACTAESTTPLPAFEWAFPDDHPTHGPRADAFHAVSIRGYPAWDAPIAEYLLRRRGAMVEVHDREHVPLTADRLAKQKLLIYDGSLTRAKVQPDTLADSDIAALETWLQAGGTLILFSQRADIFKSDPGRVFLARHVGTPPRATPASPVIAQPKHPWLAHLTTATPSWLAPKTSPLPPTTGDAIITNGSNFSQLWQTKAGRGRIIYLGWSVGGQLTDNRRGSTVEADAAMIEQVRIVGAILDDVLKHE